MSRPTMTQAFEVAQAYSDGYKQAIQDMQNASDAIQSWEKSPEWPLVQAIRTYVIARGQQ